MRGRQPVQSSEINYHIDHVLVAKIEVMCVMNQSWKGFWCVVIVRETESSVAQPVHQRALCEESVSKQKVLCDAAREGICEGLGGLSLPSWGSVISPAQHFESPAGTSLPLVHAALHGSNF